MIDSRWKILVVEDDEDIANLILYHLDQAGLSARHVESGREVLPALKDFRPGLVILDLMLPDIDGLEICKKLKQNQELSSMPVLMVTARGAETDRIEGLEAGADDYIVKPFSPRELILRVKAVLSRAYPDRPASTSRLLEQGPIVLDPEGHEVEVEGRPVELTATEFRLLEDLMRHAGKVRTREVLLDRVWGYSFDGYARTVDTHIRRLRKKLGPCAHHVETVRGVGYRLKA